MQRHSFSQLLLLSETQDNNSDYQQLISKTFKHANVGKIKKEGLRKLIQQIQDNNLSYCGFPEFVLQSWIDPTKMPCLPLKNNRWLDTKSVVVPEEGLESENVTYSGYVVDSGRNNEYGIQAISLATSRDVDLVKYSKLLKFKLVANEAKKIIGKINKKKELEEQEATGPETPKNPPAAPGEAETATNNNPTTSTGAIPGEARGTPPVTTK